MSLLSCLVMALALPSGGADERHAAPDPYSVHAVRFSLKVRSGGRKYINSAVQKQLSRLGDRVSIALLKILDPHQLAEPQTIRNLLPVVRDTFATPRLISYEEDKHPQVTILLLEHLRAECADSEVKREITVTLDFVKQRTGDRPPQPE